jgi:peptidoglycan/LPS O-acetylase OafA/YrhL
MLTNPTNREKPKFIYIDCLRGIAILMVIASHVTAAYPGLPWRATQLLATGWHGVQLFFLASCITLMLSWHHDRKQNRGGPVPFLLKRFCRIAPAYYLAALAYLYLLPPVTGFQSNSFVATLLFVNGWSPELMTTIPGSWSVVLGGWSISVEFTFYFLFPLFVSFVTTIRRALATFVAGIFLACSANDLFRLSFSGYYPEVAVRNFLYFWFPNQFCVFALGAVAYHLIRPGRQPLSRLSQFCSHPDRWLFSLVGVYAVLAFIPLGHSWSFLGIPPAFAVMSVVLLAFTCILSQAPTSVFINPVFAWVGRLSFSAYLIHWWVIKFLLHEHGNLFFTSAGRYDAIFAYSFGFFAVVVLTCVLASFSYNCVEKPMIAVGRHLLAAIRRPPKEDEKPIGLRYSRTSQVKAMKF